MLYRFPLSLVRQGLFPVVAWLALLLCPSVALAEGFVTFGLGRTNFGEEEGLRFPRFSKAVVLTARFLMK